MWFMTERARFKAAFGQDPNLATIQARLNELGADPPLDVDGIPGPKTTSAIEAFQAANGLQPDGIVGPLTLSALGMNAPSASSTAAVPLNALIAVRGLSTRNNAFKRKLVEVSARLGIDPNWLAAVISFETAGTFSPTIQNKYTRATGLIQFMPTTATRLGTTVDALARMTDLQQLDYVEKYLQSFAGRMKSLDDVYLAVFMPALIGHSSSSVVSSAGEAVYDENPGFDPGGAKGYFTVGDVTSTIRSVYNNGVMNGWIPVAAAGGILFWLLSAASAAVYFYFRKGT